MKTMRKHKSSDWFLSAEYGEKDPISAPHFVIDLRPMMNYKAWKYRSGRIAVRAFVVAVALAAAPTSIFAQVKPNSSQSKKAASPGDLCQLLPRSGWRSRHPNWVDFGTDRQACLSTTAASGSTPGDMEWCATEQWRVDCLAAAAYADSLRSDAEKLARQLGTETDTDSGQSSSDANALAKQLGVAPPDSSSKDRVILDSSEKHADLARRMGIAIPKGASEDYTAAQLEQALEKWKAEKKAEQEEQERQRRIREEQERLAAVERQKREAIQREQLAARQQQLEEERQERERLSMNGESEGNDCSGFLGFVGCVAEGVGKAAYDYQTREMMTSGWPTSGANSADSASDSGDSCRNDPALVSRVQSIMENCGAGAPGICSTARATAACFGRAAAAAGSCASVAAQARDLQRQYEAQAQAACER